MSNAAPTSAQPAIAVLTSGGVDSAILLAESRKSRAAVWPLYVRSGLAWEEAELHHLTKFIERIASPALRPLQILELPVADLYGAHWSLTGANVPDAQSPDEAVYLPGRNLLLLAKSLLWCHLHGVAAVALAVLKGNPFSDATAEFFEACQNMVNASVNGHVQVLRPYDKLTKREVVLRGKGLPLALTFSCIRPTGGKHCGQ
ncbi:MAG TPA: 7-cyano-7-deazaguanine synthase, partial [Gemmataceae bacterium]|nr:7-cyano-7-deazaguanine synthase [Gemmataceae bacterium]